MDEREIGKLDLWREVLKGGKEGKIKCNASICHLPFLLFNHITLFRFPPINLVRVRPPELTKKYHFFDFFCNDLFLACEAKKPMMKIAKKQFAIMALMALGWVEAIQMEGGPNQDNQNYPDNGNAGAVNGNAGADNGKAGARNGPVLMNSEEQPWDDDWFPVPHPVQ